MLPGVNALMLVHMLTHHYYGRFASMDDHLYATRQLPLLFLCHHSFGRAKEYEKSFLASQLVRAPRFSSDHIYCEEIFLLGDCHISLLNWLHVCASLSFPRALILLPFFSKNFSHSPFSSTWAVFEVWNFQKRDLLQTQYSKTFFLQNSINGWFFFH